MLRPTDCLAILDSLAAHDRASSDLQGSFGHGNSKDEIESVPEFRGGGGSKKQFALKMGLSGKTPGEGNHGAKT